MTYFKNIFAAILITAFTISEAQSAQLAYWSELRILARDLGAVSHLDKICGEQDGLDIPWFDLFNQIQSDPLITEPQRRLLSTIYAEGRNSHRDVYATCTQNAASLLLSLSEQSLETLSKLAENYLVEDVSPVAPPQEGTQ